MLGHGREQGEPGEEGGEDQGEDREGVGQGVAGQAEPGIAPQEVRGGGECEEENHCPGQA